MPRQNGNKFLENIERLLNQALGGYPNGTLELQEVLNLHGGVEIYIPTSTDLYVGFRNRQIINEFRGDNHQELSIKYSLSVSQVRRIIKRGFKSLHLPPVNEKG